MAQEPAEEIRRAEPVYAAAVAYDTHYLFRGASYGRHVSSLDISRSFSLSEQWTATLGTWLAHNAEGSFGSYSEIDLYGRLDYAFADGTVLGLTTTTYTYYSVPWAIEPEAGLHLDRSVGPVDLSLLGIHDFEDEGDYAQLTAVSALGVTDWLELQPSAVLALNHRYFIEDAGLSHFGVSCAASFTLSERASLRPYVSYQWPLDAGRDSGLVATQLYGGVALNLEF